MTAVVSALRELAKLFVDDGWFALAILTVIALAGLSSILLPGIPLAAGAILLFGCLGVLLVNVARAVRS